MVVGDDDLDGWMGGWVRTRVGAPLPIEKRHSIKD